MNPDTDITNNITLLKGLIRIFLEDETNHELLIEDEKDILEKFLNDTGPIEPAHKVFVRLDQLAERQKPSKDRINED